MVQQYPYPDVTLMKVKAMLTTRTWTQTSLVRYHSVPAANQIDLELYTLISVVLLLCADKSFCTFCMLDFLNCLFDCCLMTFLTGASNKKPQLEPETQAMLSWLREHQFNMLLHLRASSDVITYPYDSEVPHFVGEI